MAVQAQYPSNILPELRNRTTQGFAVENRGFFAPLSYGTSLLEDCQLSASGATGTTNVANQQRILHPMVLPIHGQAVASVALIPQSGVDISHVLGTRKRTRDSVDYLSVQRQQHTPLSLGEIQQKRASSPIVQQSTGLVSTGLRLAFDDDRVTASTTTPGRPEGSSTVLSALYEDVSAQMMQQQEELDQFLTTQKEQFRQALEERRHRHSRALLATIEDSVSRRLREKEIELEKVNRKNLELEERVKKLNLEAHLWQSKAKNNEAMVTALRSNLQLAQSREHSKEGCGDSEADDAASANYDDNVAAQARAVRTSRDLNKDLMRACRVCRANEVSILLLPCRHLCLCKSCEGSIEICPLCHCPKNASVEVYMS